MSFQIPYKIYTIEDIDKKVRSFKNNEKVKKVIINLGYLKIGIVFELDFCKSTYTSHIDFYAMSQGLEKFTTTGYKSIWIYTNKMLTDEEIEEHIIRILKKEDIEIDIPIQLSLF